MKCKYHYGEYMYILYQIEVIYIQPLTAFAFQMVSCAKVAFLLDITRCLSLEIP